MDPTNTPVVPVEMEQARQELERWRSTRPHRSPIPESLWAVAVELARQHGIHPTARALRLDYTRLKARVKPARRTSVVRSKPTRRRPSPPAFVELIAPRPGNSAECRVELEGPRGRMRIDFKGISRAELVALSRALWEGAAPIDRGETPRGQGEA
jgi:hypothetical protein